MIKLEIFLQKEGDFRISNKQRISSGIKDKEISLICENTPNFKKNLKQILLQKEGVSC
jgi:hypothetical protein